MPAFPPLAHERFTSRTAAGSSSLSLYRHVYENKTIRTVVVSAGNQALFKNCTFNGTIVTNTPQSLNSGWWMCNCLYFTGEAAFKIRPVIRRP